ncbi:hypothetical protein MMC08_008401 [Hypocenomyce scalaris]|nr:hypothetical protein [Hypocenomyce scalaris]
MGKANGLDLAELEAGRESNGTRSKNSKLWQTATFLQGWLAIRTTQTISKQLQRADVLGKEMQSLAYDASAGFETSTTMNKLLSIMRGVYVYGYTAPLAYYVDHLRKLEVCGLRLPTDPRFPSARPESQNVPVAALMNIPEEQRMALLYLHTMHLGTMIALTWPLLLQVATASIIGYQEQDPDLAKREELAYKCNRRGNSSVALNPLLSPCAGPVAFSPTPSPYPPTRNPQSPQTTKQAPNTENPLFPPKTARPSSNCS